jgi:hypothetical protein
MRPELLLAPLLALLAPFFLALANGSLDVRHLHLRQIWHNLRRRGLLMKVIEAFLLANRRSIVTHRRCMRQHSAAAVGHLG